MSEWIPTDSRFVSRDGGEDVYLSSFLHEAENVWVVMAWSRGDGLIPQLVQLSIGVGSAPDLGCVPVHWLSGGGVVSTRLIRTLNLSDAESQCRKALSIDAGGPPTLPPLVSVAPERVLDATAARALGFRTVTGLRAAVARIKVSYKYVELVSQGVVHPVLTISNDLGMAEREVRARLQQSRMAGYLNSGTQGKAAGSITDKAQKLSARLAEYLSERAAA